MFFSLEHFSQTIESAQDPQFMLEPITVNVDLTLSDTTANPMDLLDNTPVEVYVSFNVIDTLDIDSIHISVGTTPSGNEMINQQVIPFDGSGTTAIPYNREEQTILLDLGQQTNLVHLFGTIYFTNNQGHRSETISFSTQE